MLVDQRKFRELFRDHLFWQNPDQPPLRIEVDGVRYTLEQVAGFKGLRVWYCPVLPSKKIQRLVDQQVGTHSTERLLLFADEHNQAWRWPRRAQLGAVNAKLVLHEYRVGDDDRGLLRRLDAIKIGLDEQLTLVDLLARMRAVFDHEAETASEQAARLMGTLYAELENAGWDQYNATLLLARLLFLYFADDSGMWKHDARPEMFQAFIRDHTTAESLATDLEQLFEALNAEPASRDGDLPEVIREFRYVNGGLFTDDFTMGHLTPAFRDELIDAGEEFDWSTISPAVFGSMFQTVKTRSERREGGEHYTSEANILRAINPLFMHDLRDKFARRWNSTSHLTELRNELGAIRVLDPACGCGNFLIVAYRELRALELEILLRQRDLALEQRDREAVQMSFDVSGDVQVTLDHFYGIEIEEWPARIAETAMLLVDHLANQRMAEEFGFAPDRLPIRVAPTIHLGSALTVDWSDVVPAEELTYIVGNPPFYGSRKMNAVQKQELRAVAEGLREVGFLDFVAGWYILAARMMARNPSIRTALVSTNSVAQGEQPAILWRPFYEAGLHINFGHQTFDWQNGSPDEAAVDCVIVGFSPNSDTPRRIFSYGPDDATPVEHLVESISPYLISGAEYVVGNRQNQIAGHAEMKFGNMAADDGNLIFSPAERDDLVVAFPQAERWLLPFYGSQEYINGGLRYALWLDGVGETEWRLVPEVVRRVEANRETRAKSSRPQLAQIPHLFAQITQRPTGPFLIVPSVSSESRRYVPMGFFGAGVLASNLCLTVTGATTADFALMTSEIHMDWMRTIGGRLESRYRYSKDVVYNNFVFPNVTTAQEIHLAELGQAVLDVRASHADHTLAWMYDEATMPTDLRAAHLAVDRYVDSLYLARGFDSASDRVSHLLDLHRQHEAGLLAGLRTERRGRRR